jgi:hypothetical protein
MHRGSEPGARNVGVSLKTAGNKCGPLCQAVTDYMCVCVYLCVYICICVHVYVCCMSVCVHCVCVFLSFRKTV